MNAIFFVLFLCGEPAYFAAASGPAYTVAPIDDLYQDSERGESLRRAFDAAIKQNRVIRIYMDKLTGRVCI